ncbi:hypothetical protein [Burkholderia ubonensis]|uniref:hypothetical protein n=1 Tax=Burkholderia ubonensis TaxID=101571 RepID=UPI0012F983D6|nr:hypothetical protein [Burkholderia ubonensis]
MRTQIAMREVSLNSFSMQPRRNFVRLFIEDSSAAGDLFALVQHGDPPLHVTDVPHLDWS